MMLIVSGVGALIVAYSIGYMDGDDEERRYFAYMALFVFSMLLLVEGGNLLILLVGWGLVGLSSYLLIGFWHDRPSAVAAAKKAFVMNAIGDATMALALFLLIQRTGSLNFDVVFADAGSLGTWTANLVALGLLGGAVAKSAQLPLQTWLPDAMEGPTPVSALIHAATMVTAGVYLIVRTSPLFEAAPRVLELAGGLGAITLVLAGLIALVQTDIKRVIAYSTMSQIGYMFLAVGLGAYADGMFHLMEHAFFKALLFMAAGLVIHALAGEQDIRKMGGLRRLMPFTFVAFLIGTLSLAGIPPFSGFFSKDSILAAALAHGWYGELLWVAGMIGTFLTGLYAARLFFIVFWGEPSAFVREHLMLGSHASGAGGASLAQRPRDPRARRRGPPLDDLDRRHPRRARVVRRLDPVRRPLDADLELARPRGRTARRGDRDSGGRLLDPRRRARPGRDLDRLGDLRRAARPGAADRAAANAARAQVLLRRAVRPALLPARGAARDRALPPRRAAARARLDQGARPGDARGGPGDRAPPDGARPHLCALDRGEPGDRHRRLRGGQMNSGWLTTSLIVLPVAGALVVWLLPLRPFAVGSTALLFALVEVGLWIDTVAQFDFSKPGLQLDQQTSWFSDLNVSYHVGFYGFSVWLVGLAAVVLAAAIGYAFWAGRERPRAYYGLMLLLTGAIVGVFVAQDLLLFYVFWEAMLVPLYVLVGVWGGAGRLRATLMFVIYTMAGSLLMLASIIVLGLSQGTFDLVTSGTNGSDWIFLGFVAAFAVKAPLFPLHAWLPEAYRESSPEVAGVLSGVVSKAAAYGFLRIAIAKFPGPVSDFRTPILVLAACGLVYGSLLAFRAPDVRGVIAYSSLAQMGLITLGLFAVNDLGLNGAVLQMVNHGLISATLFLLAGGIERRTATGDLALLGGMARGRPALATVLLTAGVIALAVPGSTAFAGEFAILAGVFQTGWGYAVVGAVAIVLAAMYVLRLISAVLHDRVGSAVPEGALDLRPAELGVVVPLVAILLVLSAWPAAITERSFTGSAANVVGTGA